MSTYKLALMFFLLSNPIGASPLIMALIKDFSFERQKQIILREGLAALALALFFQFFGEYFLTFLGVKLYSLSLSGGIILLLTAIKMLFSPKESDEPTKLKKEPMIVPIATPLLAGPGLMTIIMIYSTQEADDLKITSALLLAWVGVLTVLYAAPYLQKLLGKRGMSALQQVMGLVLAFLAIELLLAGLGNFIKQI